MLQSHPAEPSKQLLLPVLPLRPRYKQAQASKLLPQLALLLQRLPKLHHWLQGLLLNLYQLLALRRVLRLYQVEASKRLQLLALLPRPRFKRD